MRGVGSRQGAREKRYGNVATSTAMPPSPPLITYRSPICRAHIDDTTTSLSTDVIRQEQQPWCQPIQAEAGISGGSIRQVSLRYGP